jgi:hypothetical protein
VTFRNIPENNHYLGVLRIFVERRPPTASLYAGLWDQVARIRLFSIQVSYTFNICHISIFFYDVARELKGHIKGCILTLEKDTT